MESTLVSIVIPVYNGEKYLRETIDSVLDQDYPEVEVIVVNDGSKDTSEQIAKSYGDKIKLISQVNQGQSEALNNGWRAARGELIGYISADDKLLKSCVREIVEEFSTHPEIIMIYPDYELIDQHSHIIKTVHAPEYSRHELLVECLCAPGPGALMKREYFKMTKGWDSSLSFVPDWEYWVRLSRFGHFKRVAKVLAQFRVHTGSTVFTPPNEVKADETLKVISKFYHQMDKRNPLIKEKPQALSFGHLYSARLHTSAGRYLKGIHHFANAASLYPKNILKPFFWRFLLGGLKKRLQTIGLKKRKL